MPAGRWDATDQGRDRALRLDHERRRAVQELASLLSELVEHAHTMTEAAFRGDIDALADARTTLLEIAANPALDLGTVTAIYNGLRTAVADGQHRRPDPTGPPLLPAPGGIAKLRPKPASEQRWIRTGR